MYGKVFQSTFEGSLIGTGFKTFAVWVYAIVHADPDGMVSLVPGVLAETFGENKVDVEAAIANLCAPDSESSSQDEDGRRMVKEKGFRYRIVNHAAYRKISNAEALREYEREKKRKYRNNKCFADSSETETINNKQDTIHIHSMSGDMSRDNHVCMSAAEVLKIWNEATVGKLSEAKLTPDRKRAIAERQRESGSWLSDFTNACHVITASPFYQGNNERKWSATVDYLLKPGKATEISERRSVPKQPGKPMKPALQTQRENRLAYEIQAAKERPQFPENLTRVMCLLEDLTQ